MLSTHDLTIYSEIVCRKTGIVGYMQGVSCEVPWYYWTAMYTAIILRVCVSAAIKLSKVYNAISKNPSHRRRWRDGVEG